MTWNLTGACCAFVLALFAYTRSRARGGYYDADVYGMTPVIHRRYAFAALGWGLGFTAATIAHAGTIGLWLFAPFVVFALFYLTSFLRGAHEDDD